MSTPLRILYELDKKFRRLEDYVKDDDVVRRGIGLSSEVEVNNSPGLPWPTNLQTVLDYEAIRGNADGLNALLERLIARTDYILQGIIRLEEDVNSLGGIPIPPPPPIEPPPPPTGGPVF